jgi:hypothetical protein
MSVYAFKINSDTNIIESVFVVNKNAVLGPAGIPTTEVVVKYCIDLFGPGYYHWNDPTLKGSPSANRIYDSARNAVYDVKPFPSWVLNTNTCEWEPEKINGTPNMYIENVNGIQYAAFQWLEDRKRWQARVPMRDGANGPLFIWNPLTNSYEDKI